MEIGAVNTINDITLRKPVRASQLLLIKEDVFYPAKNFKNNFRNKTQKMKKISGDILPHLLTELLLEIIREVVVLCRKC